MIFRAAPILRGALAVVALSGVLALAACAPDETEAGPGVTPSAVASRTADASASASPTPSPTAIALPDDCRAILSDAVLAELGDTPLNPPNVGSTGVQADGSLVCLWRDPAADITGVSTDISRMNRGPALDMLNALADDQGFSCYTPAGGTRCERFTTTPDDAQYPGIVEGRTLFWRDGILIDSRFTNLAPTGYTDSIIQHVFG